MNSLIENSGITKEMIENTEFSQVSARRSKKAYLPISESIENYAGCEINLYLYYSKGCGIILSVNVVKRGKSGPFVTERDWPMSGVQKKVLEMKRWNAKKLASFTPDIAIVYDLVQKALENNINNTFED
jgi:hypothetical protein